MSLKFRTQKLNNDMPGVQDVDPQEVWEKRGEILVVDVRRPDEYEGEHGHIAGAYHLVLDTLPTRLEEVPKDKPVVFVCGLGGRSARACAFASEQGYTNVFNMKGGMQAWHALSLQVERES